MFHFGILGCGMIANVHAAALAGIENAVLLGVADNNEAYAQRFAEKNGVKAYKNYEEMLNDPQIDVVCICTPSCFHATNAMEAMRAGKHVVLEKPMALSTQEADEVIKISKETGKFTTVICQLRFSSDIQRVKKLMEEKAFGKITLCNLSMKYYRSQDYYASSPWKGTLKFDGGGALMNQGIHGIDILLSVMGKVRSVHGLARTLARKIETEDTAAAIVEYENGALGLIQGTTSVYPGYPRNFVVSGTKGTVGIAENAFAEWNIEGEAIPADIEIGKAKNSGASTPHDLDFAEHVPHIEEMVRAIREDVPLTSSFEDGRNAVKLITSIYESSRTGKTIYFD